MRSINAHLTGRPLHTFLWFIWLFAGQAWLMYTIAKGSTRYSGAAVFLSLLCAGFAGLFIAKLIAVYREDGGKAWLDSVYREEEHRRARADLKGLVILVPVLVGLALLAPLLFEDALL